MMKKFWQKFSGFFAVALVAAMALPTLAFAETDPVLDAALGTVQTSITDTVAGIGPKIALAAAAGIGLGAISLGIRFLWRTFKGAAK